MSEKSPQLDVLHIDLISAELNGLVYSFPDIEDSLILNEGCILFCQDGVVEDVVDEVVDEVDGRVHFFGYFL